MAKKPQKKAAAKPGRDGGSKIRTALVWVIAPVLMVVFHLETLLLAIALVPTLVAWISDTAPVEVRRHYAAKSVGAMNVVGALWPLVQMHQMGADWGSFLDIVRNPLTWIICLAASAIGWAIHLAMPPMVTGYFRLTQDGRRQTLKQSQDKLLKEWGTQVKKFAPPELSFQDAVVQADAAEEAPFEPEDQVEQQQKAIAAAPPAAQGRVRRVGGGNVTPP